MEDYYKLLGIHRERFQQDKEGKEKLKEKYEKIISKIDEEIEENHLNEEKISKLKELKEQCEKAYEILSDDKLRKNYDFKLSVEWDEISSGADKKKAEFPSDNYSNIMNQIFYKKVQGEKFDVYDDKNMRMIYIEPIGELYFETKFNYRNAGDVRYKIRIVDLLTKEEDEAVIFTHIDKHRLKDDEGYRKFLTEELFSEKNIENGTIFNGGYIGEISENEGKYKIGYEKETLCAAMDFSQSPEKRKIDFGKDKDKMKPGDICKISTRDDREKEKNQR